MWPSEVGIFENEMQKEREKINEIETQINDDSLSNQEEVTIMLDAALE